MKEAGESFHWTWAYRKVWAFPPVSSQAWALPVEAGTKTGKASWASPGKISEGGKTSKASHTARASSLRVATVALAVEEEVEATHKASPRAWASRGMASRAAGCRTLPRV